MWKLFVLSTEQFHFKILPAELPITELQNPKKLEQNQLFKSFRQHWKCWCLIHFYYPLSKQKYVTFSFAFEAASNIKREHQQPWTCCLIRPICDSVPWDFIVVPPPDSRLYVPPNWLSWCSRSRRESVSPPTPLTTSRAHHIHSTDAHSMDGGESRETQHQ